MKITESKLVDLIKECYYEVIKEELSGYGISPRMNVGGGDIREMGTPGNVGGEISYNGEGDNSEEWFEAGLTPEDFKLVPDEEIAMYHSSNEGYLIKREGEDFGEVWLDRRSGMYCGNSDDDVFGGYLTIFQGYGTDGILEDIMDKTADAIINGGYDEEEDY